MSEPALELRDVSFAYDGVPVLEHVSLRVEPHATLAILGPNGSGKTTLLRVALGLLRPHAGTARVFGRPAERAHGLVGYVPQRARFDLDFPIRVLDVVLMGRLAARGPGRRFQPLDRERARAALARMEVADLAGRPIGALSEGQRQRVLISRALALEPRLLLLDEPTASLDERAYRSVWDLIGELSREMAVVCVSHDIGAISRSVRSVACLNRRLYGHPDEELTSEALEAAYGCPVDLLAHGHPHRVLPPHEEGR